MLSDLVHRKVLGGDFGLSGLGSMARDACDRSRRMANRIAAVRTADDRVCVLQLEQRVVGDLGSLCRGVCIDRLTGLSIPNESPGLQEKLQRAGKGAVS